jgi:hypothetical protein
MLRFFKRAAGRAVTQVMYRVIMATVGIVVISYITKQIANFF